MPQAAQSASTLRFGVFELDLRAGELRKAGLKVRLQERPLQILSLLLENPGEVVTREELRQHLWPADTFVDFDHSVNTAINKLREALGDSAESPRFIETLPRHGYRFIGHVEPFKGSRTPTTIVESVPATAGAGTGFAPDRSPADLTPAAAERAPTTVQARRESMRWLAVVAVAATVAITVLGALVALNVGGLRGRLSQRGAAPPKIESIAVLPLENLSGDPAQEYFVDGMTEELITDLGKISALRVISRTSVMRYKGTRKPLPEIGRELHVDGIVEGAVLRSGDRVRITANLLYAPNERHLWAQTYDRNLGDVLSLQDEVARAIAGQIRVKLTPQERVRLARPRPVDPQAQEAYLKGRFFFNKLTKEDLLKAINYAQQAVKIDPSYALAYGLLASSYWESSESGFGDLPNRVAAQKTRAAATEALAIDDTVAEAHVGLACVLDRNDWNWADAEREYKRAIELNPNFGRAHAMYAWDLALVGRPDESIREARRAVNLDPFSAHTIFTLTAMYYGAHQYDQTIGQARNWLEMFPETIGPHVYLAWAFQMQGKYGEAVEEMRKRMELQEASPEEIAALDHAYRVGGIRGVWRWQLRRFKERAARGEARFIDTAIQYALLGENDNAFDWLEKAYQRHTNGLAFIQWTPCLDPLRSDPRYQDLPRRMNFPP